MPLSPFPVNGQTVSGADSDGHPHTILTDSEGHPLFIAASDPPSPPGPTSYPFNGQTISGVDSAGHPHTLLTDGAGRLILLGGGGGSSSLTAGSLNVVLPAQWDEVTGVVTGLGFAPVKVVSTVINESLPVPSGLNYAFIPTQFNPDGFNWTLRVLGNEWWPGPGPLTLLVDFIWSVT